MSRLISIAAAPSFCRSTTLLVERGAARVAKEGCSKRHCALFTTLFQTASTLTVWLALCASGKHSYAQQWETVELPVKLTVGYAVRAIDMNQDEKLDIAIVDSKRIVWLENPSWREHVIYATPDAKADNVCFAPHDVDGDGLIDLALGADWQPNNTDSGGSIGWLHQRPAGTWTYHELASAPTTHRMQWVQLSGQSKSLVVAPLKGKGSRAPGFDQTGVQLLALTPNSQDPTAPWETRTLYDRLHVMHNLHISDLDNNQRPDILCASYEGATWLQLDDRGRVSGATRLGAGQEQAAPAQGASEIRSGHLAGGRQYLATIEPWHGDKVVVYVAPVDWNPAQSKALWQRAVIDDQLAWGHAVACANLDDDPEDELIIGVRDNQSDQHRSGVRIYDSADAKQLSWSRTLIDAGGVAVEDLIVADIDGDKRQDIVAVGRATHNARLYLNRSPK